MRATNAKKIDKLAVALILCFCVIAAVSVFTVKSGIDKLNELASERIPVTQETGQEQPGAAGQTASTEVPVIDSQTSDPKNQEAGSRFTRPLNGAILTAYSADLPIYSRTLDQYTVHTGMDIAAAEGTAVCAAAEGTVTRIYSDDRFGVSVEINHGGGIVSLYSNLAPGPDVELGDVVSKGHPFAVVGNTALLESADPPHLHFAMLQNGESIDPAAYIRF